MPTILAFLSQLKMAHQVWPYSQEQLQLKCLQFKRQAWELTLAWLVHDECTRWKIYFPHMTRTYAHTGFIMVKSAILTLVLLFAEPGHTTFFLIFLFFKRKLVDICLLPLFFGIVHSCSQSLWSHIHNIGFQMGWQSASHGWIGSDRLGVLVPRIGLSRYPTEITSRLTPLHQRSQSV